MKMKIKALKAQTILEYVLILGIVAGALGAMQLYFRRGIQAAIKATADEIGLQQDAQEIDPQKGTRAESRIERFGTGIQSFTISPDKSASSTFDKTTTVTGSATYKSEREE